MPSRQTKRIIRRIIVFASLILIATGAWFGYKWWRYYKAKSTHYAAFGIAVPDGYIIHGIDVSKYQDIIAWEEVKAMKVGEIGIGFAFMKATEGIGNKDPQFPRNWKKAKDNEVIRGAYHFFIASKDGKLQAENFIKRVDIDPGDLPPVLDVEQLNGVRSVQLRKEVWKWLETVENYYNVKPIIYTNVDFYENYLGSEFDQYPLWVAHYYEPGQPRIKRDWIFWQHNDQGRVSGIIPKVDFNVFKGDSLAFKSILVR
ncbi:MAG: glycoside hydrolase family 25 protein [Chitinophagaceae bacterium]|nr:glycoside hydrolase family 25 protein [Chitinophagaceae bacterium]